MHHVPTTGLSAAPDPFLARCDWIGGPGHALCRKEFSVQGAPVKATLRVLADPHSYAIHHWQMLPTPYPYDNWLVGGSFLKFRVYLNGALVAAGPFRSLQDGVPVLHESDVTAAMADGENAVAVLSRGECKGFALSLEIVNRDGTREEIHTSDAWRQRDGNAIYRTVCWEVPAIEQYAKGGPSPGEYPEHLDGLPYPQGWRLAGFDDASWPRATTYGRATEPCETPDAPPYALTRCSPVEIRELGKGNFLVDFGRAVFGGVELASPVGGGAVELRLAEELQPNGHARYQLRTENCFQEIWRFAPDSEPLSHMGTRMFRYAEVLGWRGAFDAESISVTAIGAPFDHEASRLACSDARLERVWSFCKDTIAHTTADVFTDCLTRERLAYEADSYVTMLTHFTTEGSSATARRTLEYLVGHPSWPCEWWQFFVPLFHEYLMHSGDYDTVDRHYAFLRDQSAFHSLMRDGLIFEFPRTCIVDWPPHERDHYDFGPGNAVANAMAYWDLTLLQTIAGYLGRDRDIAGFAEQAAALAEGFNRHLFDRGAGLYVDSAGSRHHSLHANLYALRFGLVPKEHEAGVLAFIKGRGMACSVFTAQFLLETFFLHGEDRHAVDLMVSDGPKSWLEMIRHGAVATTESWLTHPKKNMSWAHPWSTSPANVVARHLFGLRPTVPGWKEYSFDPKPGGLEHGTLHLPTPRGGIVAGFERDGAGYRTSVREAGAGGDLPLRADVPALVLN